MNDQRRGHEQAKGVKEDKDIPSEPIYGLDAAGSSMTGVSMWAKITQQQNPRKKRMDGPFKNGFYCRIGECDTGLQVTHPALMVHIHLFAICAAYGLRNASAKKENGRQGRRKSGGVSWLGLRLDKMTHSELQCRALWRQGSR